MLDAVAAILLPDALDLDRLAGPAHVRAGARTAAAVRVRGRVLSGARGLGAVAVSDRLQVESTDPDGRFELVSDTTARWLRSSSCSTSPPTTPPTYEPDVRNRIRAAP